MNKSESIINLAEALANFQAEVKNPRNTDTNPQFRSKYAPLDVVVNTIRPVLAKYGLSFLQSTGSEGENIIIKTMILHKSGEWLETDPLVLPAYQLKSGGAKEFNAQGAGSAITYGRRYSLSAALGISSEDDDDGNSQTQTPQVTPSLKEKMAAKIQPPRSVVTLEVDSPLAEIPASLKEKYQAFKGSLDGLETYVTEQIMLKGKTHASIEQTLQAAIDKKQNGGA